MKATGVKINWCKLCNINDLQKATYSIPARRSHYELNDDGDIDQSFIGVCDYCLEDQSEFKKSRKVRVFNANHTRLYKKA